MAWPLWTFVAILMATFLSQSLQFRRPGQTMATIAGTILAVAYVGLLGSFMIQMRWFDGPYHGLIPLATLVATAKGSDIGAYTMGRLAGRNKLWPRLSPNKTIEGAIGGLVFGVLASLIVTAVATLRPRRPLPRLARGDRLRPAGRPGGPARRPDGIDDQARLRRQGRLGRPCPDSAGSSTSSTRSSSPRRWLMATGSSSGLDSGFPPRVGEFAWPSGRRPGRGVC